MSNVSNQSSNFSDKKKMLLKHLLQRKAMTQLPQQSDMSADSRPVILPRIQRMQYPLSWMQQYLLKYEQIVPGKYVQAVLSFNRSVNLVILRHSLHTLVERHEILRALFVQQNNIFTQSIATMSTIDLLLLDLSHLASDVTHKVVAQYFESWRSHDFDLAHGPLYRFQLVRVDVHEDLLILSLHPLLADAATLAMLCHELAVLYKNASTGQHPQLPELSLSYSDYANWQDQHRQQESVKRQLNYWKEQLAGSPQALNLPLDHPRSALTMTRHAIYTQELAPLLIQRARAVCTQEDVPLSHLLFTLFALLANYYTGQTDMLLGVLNSNRTFERESLAGPFATTLPLRVQIASGLSGQEFLHAMHKLLLRVFDYSDLVLEQIAEALYPQHDITRVPLFHLAFAFHQLPSFVGLSAHLHPLISTYSMQDLTCVFHDSDEQLFFTITYNSALFETESIERFQKHYCQLLKSFLAQPTQALSTLSCLTPEEQAQICSHWNTATETKRQLADQCIHHLFEQQVQRTPQIIALSDGSQQLTYQDLNDRANQLAHLLRRRGVKSEQLVGLCLARSLDLVVGLLAILKAGAAYLPLDPTYPHERLAFLIQDAQLSLIVTQQALVERMPFSAEQAFCLDTADLYTSERSDNVPLQIHSEQLAYVIYTSGSTGHPKGVCITHRSAVTFLSWARQQFSDEELAGVLAGTSICFDLSIFELLAPLSWGGKAILAASVLDLPHLAKCERITLLNTVPSAATSLLATGDLPSSLLTINLAGEALTRELAQALYHQTQVQRLCNLYGPTEDTTYSTWSTLCPDEEGAVPIGVPLPHTQAYIMDIHLRLVPIGVVGELYLGGDGQARGYLNRPDLTAERFVPDPLSVRAGGRLYRTGDLARYRPDGQIDYVGRLDHQVKVRGFRIELGEIEAQLRLHPLIADVVVIASERISSEKQLIAYVVVHPQQVCDAPQLRQYLLDSMPAYMVPAYFIQLASLPQTLNGKVDRKALPSPNNLKTQAQVSLHDMPQGKREQWLALLWQELLQVSAIGRTDNFFLHGGDSLLAMQLLARLKHHFQLSLSLKDIFTAPTIAQLADRLQTTPLQAESEPIASLKSRVISSDTLLPLSFGQQRLWFVDQLESGTAMYNVPLVLGLSGSLERLALYQALREIIRRHATLRTAIRVIKGKPFQRISDLSTPAFSFVDLMMSADAKEQTSEEDFYTYPALLAAMQKEVAAPFDLSTDPLLRILLLRVQEDRHVLMITMHHIITDGWSLSILANELGILYNAFSAGRPSPLPELSIEYTDFVAWEREHQAAHFAEGLAYWTECFSSPLPTLALPTDYCRPAVQTFQGASLHFSLSHTLSLQLHALSQQEEVTLFMILLTAFLVFLTRYCGQEDLVVGTSVANRSRPELEALIGFFVNTLALRADLSGNPSARTLLHRFSALALDAYLYQEVPFDQVLDAVQLQRDPARSPLFQVLFLLQNTPVSLPDMRDVHVHPLECEPLTSQFDLSFFLEDKQAGLRLTIEYNTQLFAPATIEQFYAHYQGILSAFCTQLDTPIQQLPLLTPEEQHWLVQNCNDAKESQNFSSYLYEIFTWQAMNTPNTLAVLDGECEFTYQELEQRAHQLASMLHGMGIGLALPLGKPLDDLRCYVLDAWMQLIPVGVRGDLYLAGAEIAHGYLDAPELAAQCFVPDPFSRQPGQRMYRTGDRGYRQAAGQLVFVQSQKPQTHARSSRVKLAEIERLLGDQPNIQAAAVLMREDQPGFSQLVAYVQPLTDHLLDVSLLHLTMQQELPAYMRPTAIVQLPFFPYLASGEIDREQLPAPDQFQMTAYSAHDDLEGPVEKSLARIWKKVLQLSIIDRTDNFFEIGGHSLLATQVLAAIREELQVVISIRQFFALVTIAKLAAYIELEDTSNRASVESQAALFPQLVPVAHTGEFPLSFAQQRLWFLDQLEGSNATYNIPIALHLFGELNFPVLQRCMREIMLRHETLRTTFSKEQYVPVQCIHLLPLTTVELIELSTEERVESQSAIAQFIQTEVQLPFDLARGPLLRIRVLRLSQQEHVMTFVMHHIISDGWSMSVIAEELKSLYNAFVEGRKPILPELAVQYVDFVVWQRNYLQGARLATHLAYWKQQLAGAPGLHLPTDHPRVASYFAPGASCSAQWPQVIVQRILAFSLKEDITPFMTLLAGLLVLFAYYSGQEDITIGTPIANRSHSALGPLVGLFVNTLALRVRLTGNPTFHDLLQRVRDVTLEAYEHQDVPFEQVVEAVHPQRQVAVSPLFQVLLVLQNNVAVDLSLTNLQVKPLEVHTATAKFDLSLGIEMNTDGLGFAVEYNTQLFERTTIQRLQTHYRALLEYFITNPERRLADVHSLLSGFMKHGEREDGNMLSLETS